MKALGVSYLRFFVSRQRQNVGLDFCLGRHDFGFLFNQKRLGDGLPSFRANGVSSLSAANSAQTDIESEEILTVNSDQPKTVRVKFKLHQQCAFGQQFLVVGDDPSLGLWDPSDGVPLNWSEGHLWTAEVDIPIHKVISYKFILKEIAGTVSWQPGPDRVLETWDTANTISVTEDWEIPEFQIIDEEEVVDDLNEPCLNQLNGPSSVIAENLNQIVEEEVDVVTEERADDGNECEDDQSDEPSVVMVAENIVVEDEGLMVVADNDGSNSSILKNETGMVMDEGVPVLVPGLATIQPEETEAEDNTKQPEEIEAEEKDTDASSVVGSTTTAVSDEIEVSTTTIVSDESEVSIDPNREKDTVIEAATTETDEIEVSTEDNDTIVEDITSESDETEAEICCAPASLHYAESTSVEKEEPVFKGGNKMESNMLGSNIQWGRQTIHKFLANLGFMQHG